MLLLLRFLRLLRLFSFPMFSFSSEMVSSYDFWIEFSLESRLSSISCSIEGDLGSFSGKGKEIFLKSESSLLIEFSKFLLFLDFHLNNSFIKSWFVGFRLASLMLRKMYSAMATAFCRSEGYSSSSSLIR